MIKRDMLEEYREMAAFPKAIKSHKFCFLYTVWFLCLGYAGYSLLGDLYPLSLAITTIFLSEVYWYDLKDTEFSRVDDIKIGIGMYALREALSYCIGFGLIAELCLFIKDSL